MHSSNYLLNNRSHSSCCSNNLGFFRRFFAALMFSFVWFFQIGIISCHVYFLSSGSFILQKILRSLSQKSEEKMFYTVGLLLRAGAILTYNYYRFNINAGSWDTCLRRLLFYKSSISTPLPLPSFLISKRFRPESVTLLMVLYRGAPTVRDENQSILRFPKK